MSDDRFPVRVEMPVAWGHMDAFGHVNNTVYFRWFEDARIAYFRRVGLDACMENTGIGPILASTQCRFRLPLTYPDTVSAEARVSDMGPGRFTMKYRVVSQGHGKVAAEGVGILVAYDYNEHRKATWPDSIRDAIAGLER